MNHGHQFDIALSAERKAEQERKQAEREARKKLEAAAPDLLAACKAALTAATTRLNTYAESEQKQAEIIKQLQNAITKAKP